MNSWKFHSDTKLKHIMNHDAHSEGFSDNEMPSTSETVDQGLINASILKQSESNGDSSFIIVKVLLTENVAEKSFVLKKTVALAVALHLMLLRFGMIFLTMYVV